MKNDRWLFRMDFEIQSVTYREIYMYIYIYIKHSIYIHDWSKCFMVAREDKDNGRKDVLLRKCR